MVDILRAVVHNLIHLPDWPVFHILRRVRRLPTDIQQCQNILENEYSKQKSGGDASQTREGHVGAVPGSDAESCHEGASEEEGGQGQEG